MDKDDKILLGIFIVIIAFFSIAGFFGHKSMIKENNSFCILKGYNESTDWNSISLFYRQIECDKHIIFNVTEETNTICIEYDKWGECIKEKTENKLVELK